MLNMKKKLWCMAVSILATCMLSSAELRVVDAFTDHMVLQAGKPVAVWGTAEPDQQVTVSFAGQKIMASADQNGRWTAHLSAMEYNKSPNVLTVKAGSESCSFSDVLVGEVWLCSGQSNMERSLEYAENSAKEIETANYPNIRLFTIWRKITDEPQTMLMTRKGGWQKCSPQTVDRFSAVGYFFGRKLYEELDIPIGLIQSAWSGTRIEAWIDWNVTKNDPIAGSLLPPWQEMINKTPDYHQNFAAYAKEFDECMRTSAVREKEWEARKKEANKNHERFTEPMPEEVPLLTHGNKHTPSVIYNAMIAPLAPYTLRGIIWYQGEANSSKPITYRAQLPLLIDSWRGLWNDPEMPFYVVQLANLGSLQSAPVEDPAGFADLRDAQLYVVRIVPHTALAVTLDIGDAGNIHPKNKQDVGLRLALPALNRIYAKTCEDSGPVFESLEKDSNSLWLTFSHADGLRAKNGGQIKGFAIRSENGKWAWADARISGNRIQLSASEIPNPADVRYGWAKNPIGNLVNSAELPAVPFRTDKQLSSQEKKDRESLDNYQQKKKQ